MDPKPPHSLSEDNVPSINVKGHGVRNRDFKPVKGVRTLQWQSIGQLTRAIFTAIRVADLWNRLMLS